MKIRTYYDVSFSLVVETDNHDPQVKEKPALVGYYGVNVLGDTPNPKLQSDNGSSCQTSIQKDPRAPLRRESNDFGYVAKPNLPVKRNDDHVTLVDASTNKRVPAQSQTPPQTSAGGVFCVRRQHFQSRTNKRSRKRETMKLGGIEYSHSSIA